MAYVDSIHIVVGVNSQEVFFPKYAEKVLDDDDELYEVNREEYEEHFWYRVSRDLDYIVDFQGVFMEGYDLTFRFDSGETEFPQDTVARVEEFICGWNQKMRELEDDAMAYRDTIKESRDPMALAENDIMI